MGGLFDLDADGLRAHDERVADNLIDPNNPPEPEGMDGTLEALKSLMLPSASAGRSAMVVGAGVGGGAIDKLADARDAIARLYQATNPYGARALNDLTPNFAARDAGFDIAESLGSRAVDAWTPDPAKMGGGARAVSVASQVVGSLPQLIAMPETFLATSAIDPAAELTRQGVDTDTALGVGLTNLGANAIGMRLPASIGNTLTQRIASGAGSNVLLGAGADQASNAILSSGGYETQAENYDPANLYARGLDALMGAAFGVKANIDAPRAVTRTQGDAVLTLRNDDHLRRQTLPGEPARPRAVADHLDASAAALDQLLAGEQVNVADKLRPEDFILPEAPKPATVGKPEVRGADFESIVTELVGPKVEGGYSNDPVDRGGETNFGISKRSHPKEDIPNLTQARAVEIYRAKYWDAIKADELPAEMRAVAFDAAVNQGVPWTRKALRQAGGDRAKFIALRRARYAEIIAKDPTQAKFREGWENRVKRFDAPPVADVPARQPFADPDSSSLEAFAATAKRFDLPEDAVRALAPSAPRDAVTGYFDGRVDGMKADLLTRAESHVARTGEAGHYVSADLFNLGGLNEFVGNRAEAANVHYQAMAKILRAELEGTGADVVPIRTGGDEFGAVVINADGVKVDAALTRAQAKVDAYAKREGLADIPHPKRSGEKGVGLHIGRAEIVPGETPRSILDRADEQIDRSKRSVRAEPTGAPGPAAPQGRPGGADGGTRPANGGVRRPGGGVEGQTGRGQGGERTASGSAEESAVDAARLAAEANPDLQVPDGFDADGNAQYRSIADVLADIDAERAEAERVAQAYGAAANCAIRNGGFQ